MNIVECRECGQKFRIVPRIYQETKYEEGVRCLKCWNPPKKNSVVNFPSSSKQRSTGSQTGYKNSYSGGQHGSNGGRGSAYNNDGGGFVDCTYGVGDTVFVNTDKYGVLCCPIIDTEAWGPEYIFYTIDVKGISVDYVEEDEIFDTAQEAHAAETVVKVM